MIGGLLKSMPGRAWAAPGVHGAGYGDGRAGQAKNAKRLNASNTKAPPDVSGHFCRCGVWGAFGTPRADGALVWRCGEHREKIPVFIGVDRAAGLDRTVRGVVRFPKQGSLL